MSSPAPSFTGGDGPGSSGRPQSSLATSTSGSPPPARGQGAVESGLLSEAREALYAGKAKKLSNWDSESLFDADEPRIKEDILRMVVQYLQNEGYQASTMCIKDEANVKISEQLSKRTQYTRVRKGILEGEWGEVEKLVQKTPIKNQKSFL
mmetsp:Transcript_64860/g.204847  ORF Transcript_64860/g.204847 Transcript_64860/m.204847 type:complete len:151 (-) Transcript_64860:61-513(-)